MSIKIDFDKMTGKIKPMNAVNNGPAAMSVRGDSNFDLFKAANIPFTRLHDSCFCEHYGGEWSVDVHRIFRNFDADENDPASYDFEMTDIYMRSLCECGTEIFYRLGASIEHYKKEGTFPPKNYLKWAKICEHIILHYNQGWANGFKMNVKYWEVWNEPDCGTLGHNPCWQGTDEQFVDFFVTAVNYLKNTFPSLKIGGPAFCNLKGDHPRSIMRAIAEKGLKLDFISYHQYAADPKDYVSHIRSANEFLREIGYGDCETYLNEWNYSCGFQGENWTRSIKTEQSLKGASFITGVMCACQREDVTALMYYDARLNFNMNGLFDTFMQPRKGYYSIAAFGKLLALGNEVFSESNDDGVYVCAAKGNDGKKLALMTYYLDAEPQPDKTVEIELSGAKTATVYLLDEKHDLEKSRVIDVSDGKISLELKLYDTAMLEIE